MTRWPDGRLRAGHSEMAARVLPLATAVAVPNRRMERLDVPISALAKRVGVNRATLSRTLAGETWPAWDLITSMAFELDAPEALTEARKSLPPMD
jgi:transcriptional regulator with XRE-family HTH domain